MVVTGKVGGSEGREVGVSLASILGLKDGPSDWQDGGYPAHSGQGTGCRGSSPLHYSCSPSTGPGLVCFTLLTAASLKGMVGPGVEGLPLPHFLAKQY